MMKRFIISFMLLAAGLAFAANPRLAKESAKELAAALAEALGTAPSSIAYLPEYGLHIALANLESDFDSDLVAQKLSSLLKTFSETLKGLDETDWLSVSFRGQAGFMTNEYEVVVRYRLVDEVLEHWLDGKKQ